MEIKLRELVKVFELCDLRKVYIDECATVTNDKIIFPDTLFLLFCISDLTTSYTDLRNIFIREAERRLNLKGRISLYITPTTEGFKLLWQVEEIE